MPPPVVDQLLPFSLSLSPSQSLRPLTLFPSFSAGSYPSHGYFADIILWDFFAVKSLLKAALRRPGSFCKLLTRFFRYLYPRSLSSYRPRSSQPFDLPRLPRPSAASNVEHLSLPNQAREIVPLKVIPLSSQNLLDFLCCFLPLFTLISLVLCY